MKCFKLGVAAQFRTPEDGCGSKQCIKMKRKVEDFPSLVFEQFVTNDIKEKKLTSCLFAADPRSQRIHRKFKRFSMQNHILINWVPIQLYG